MIWYIWYWTETDSSDSGSVSRQSVSSNISECFKRTGLSTGFIENIIYS